MKKTFITTTGEVIRDLTSEEVKLFASRGDIEAKKELLSIALAKATTIQEQINALKEYIGV